MFQLSSSEIKRAVESLIFLVVKRDNKVKTRLCANGSTQQEHMTREDTASPMVSNKATMFTAPTEAEEGRDVATCDMPMH